MPGGSWANLFTRATVFYKSINPHAGDNLAIDDETLTSDLFTSQAMTAIDTLNDEWYDVSTGIWDDAWWNSGNAFTVLADFAALRPEDANMINIGGYLRNTYVQAQTVRVQTTKEVDPLGMVSSFSTFGGEDEDAGEADSAGDTHGAENTGHWGKNTWDKRQFPQFR